MKIDIIQPKSIDGNNVSFVTQSQSVYHKGVRLYDMLEGNESVKIDKFFNAKYSWKFKLISSTSNTSYSDISPAATSYDDSSWDDISIPHDWSIHNAFNSASPATYEGGYLDGGDAWYRRKLTGIASYSGKQVYLMFDGVYMESTVYVNGTKVKQNYWYNPFYVEISQYLNFDGSDVIAVFVRNQQPSSRYYSGSGIIRDVNLLVCDSINISLRSPKITTPNLSSEYSSGYGNVVDAYDISNNTSSDVSCLCAVIIKDSKGNIVSQSLSSHTASANGISSFSQTIKVPNPVLWSVHSGNYYLCETVLYINNKLVCSRTDKFGFRWFTFSADSGFAINGVSTKIRGVCLHHDNGCLGAAEHRSAIERKIQLLKDMGCNAIRTSHNPASSILLDVCMEKGMMVDDEFFDCWETKKKTYDFAVSFTAQYAQVVKDTVMRDRNNPAVIMWSVGNEIDSPTASTATALRNEVLKYDNTRPVTMADNHYSTASIACDDVFDIVGMNYKDGSMSSIHSAHPTWKLYGSETTSALASRVVYARDDTNYQCSSFDNDKVSWGNYAAASLKVYEGAAYLAGMFVWTGWDYIGEPTPFNKYPCKSSYFGIIDLAGFPKDIYYMYQSRWMTSPMIHILPHWNWASGTTQSVWLYSNCYKVELFLNGVSLGTKLQSNIGDKLQFAYSVAYAAGTLLAIGYDSSGNEVARDTVITAGDAAALNLQSDKSNVGSDELAFLECDVIDANGNICPIANNEVTFTVVGGTIRGLDNGDATDVTKMEDVNIRKAFNGKCLCVVSPNSDADTIIVKASATGLTDAYTAIKINNK